MALLSFERKYRVPGGTLIGRDLFDFWVGPFILAFWSNDHIFCLIRYFTYLMGSRITGNLDPFLISINPPALSMGYSLLH